jgi:hypothetical protein
MPDPNWTDKERAHVLELYRTQLLTGPADLYAIAFEVGRTVQSVAWVLRQAGIFAKAEYARIEPETENEFRNWCIEGDQAFTSAMFKAIEDGAECPPKIGIVHTHEGLAGLRRYYPEPRISYSSPAGDVADLARFYA